MAGRRRRRLAQDGDEIILHGRRADEVQSRWRRLGGEGIGGQRVSGRSGDRTAVAQIADEAGDVDVLINGAGIYREMAVEGNIRRGGMARDDRGPSDGAVAAHAKPAAGPAAAAGW